jgi:hypothetical protein
MRSIKAYTDYVKNNWYKKYIGVIYYYDITSTLAFQYKYKDESSCEFRLLTIDDDLEDVIYYYRTNGKSFVNEKYLKDNLKTGGYVCIALDKEQIIAANCLFTEDIDLHGGSKYTLYERNWNKIHFDSDTLYSCYILTQNNARSKGIYQQMHKYIVHKLSLNNDYKKIVLITNTNNNAMMHICNKHFTLIGIVSVSIFMGKLFSRKELYFDEKYLCWKKV